MMHKFWRSFAGVLIASLTAVISTHAQTNFPVYSDQLDNGFQDWSWGTHNFTNTAPVHSGTYSISSSGVTWDGISFWHSTMNPRPYTNLNFWANGGSTGGQILQIYFEYDTNKSATYTLSALPTNSWKQYFLPFNALGAGNWTNFNRISFQLTSSGHSGVYYLDDVNLSALPPATVHLRIDANQTIRSADARWLGLNTAVWDGNFDTATTSNALAELGTQILRFPGGSLSDEYHWATDKSLTNTWTWATSFANFRHIATNAGVRAMITVNYGTGTTNEAADWVRSANVTNHLGFTYWEIGNEVYGSWETDSNTFPHDPYTYAVRAKDYITQMKLADPTIKIGVVAVTGENSYSNSYSITHPTINPRTGTTNYGWTPVMLSTLKSLGVTPDFLVHHVYPEFNSDNDQSLLAVDNWASDAADLRQQITDYIGSGGTNIELIVTENNSDAGNQGRQSTSIVNGLYLADSIARIAKTEFNGFIWWDLRNGTDTNGDFNSSLYGWRTNGDLGIIGDLNTRYPTFYMFKLMRFFARAGDTVLDASTDYQLLPTYASRKADGSIAVLVINKDRYTTFNAQLTVTNFVPWTNATARSFGIAQDEATRTNGPAAAQDIGTNTLVAVGTNTLTSFPPYTATLITIPPAAPNLTSGGLANNQFVLQVQGQSGVRYILQSSTNLTSWSYVATNTLAGTTWNTTNSLGSPQRFWRAVWLPVN